MHNRFINFLMVFFVSFFLASCGESGDDGSARVKRPPLKQKSQLKKPPLKVEPKVDKTQRRDPFLSFLAKVEAEKPKSEIPKGPLESHELKSFNLLMVIVGKRMSRAKIIAPDGKTYTVKVGDKLGLNSGRIVRITDRFIKVREPVRDIDGKRVGYDDQEIALPEKLKN